MTLLEGLTQFNCYSGRCNWLSGACNIAAVSIFFQIRKAIREALRLRIDRASAGAQYSGNHRWDNIAAFVINEGGSTVSVTETYI